MRDAIILSALAAAVHTAAAQTTVLIDDFSDGQQVLERGTEGSLSETAAATSAIGGVRTADLDVLDANFGIKSLVEINRNDSDVYAFSSGAANTAAASLLYDAGQQGLGLELRSDSVFDLSFLFSDMAFEMSVVLEDDAGNLANAGVTVPESGGQNTVQIAAAQFDAEDGFDLGAIHSIDFDFNAAFDPLPPGGQGPPEQFLAEAPAPALDFIIDSISVTTPPIPSPATFVLAGSGFALIASRRRR